MLKLKNLILPRVDSPEAAPRSLPLNLSRPGEHISHARTEGMVLSVDPRPSLFRTVILQGDPLLRASSS